VFKALPRALRPICRAASSSVGQFVGAPTSEILPELKFWLPNQDHLPPILPTFRPIDDLGCVVPGGEGGLPELSQETALAMQETMLKVSEFDRIFNDAQRQGRISFYLTSRGEEACAVGSCAALESKDWILPQYRELGAALWRGFTYEEIANQTCSNALDPASGRQMPLHIGSREKRLLTISSPLGTQCPQAAGVAFGMKVSGKKEVALTYFGEGCASEGDVPSAFNIAAVHRCPTVFFCRNNGYAISTNAADQYTSDGIAPRGLAFGMPSIRVDGNDILAVYAATRAARELSLSEGRPVLIEAMTYRVGTHSTSDDDSKYRTQQSPAAGWDSERAYWEARSPIIRFGRYLQAKGWYSAQLEEELRRTARRNAIAALNAAQEVDKPGYDHLFTDVYDTLPWMLAEQRAQLKAHVLKYEQHYGDVLSRVQGMA